MQLSIVTVVCLVCCAQEVPLSLNLIKPLEQLSTDTQTIRWILLDDSDDKNFNYEAPEVNPEPDFNAERDVIFRLYTNRSLINPEIIRIKNLSSVVHSFWNSSNPTRIIIHGRWANGESLINILMREAYLAVGEFNVVTVDWGVGSEAVRIVDLESLLLNMRMVGVLVGRFIDWLYENYFLDFRQISIIGHSLGAHVSGIAGKHVTHGRVHTIVGLDPALSIFTIDNQEGRVADTDAEYVEIIHTSAGEIGFDLPLGTSDFYPNGGTFQPGCDQDGGCAHSIVISFMAESINPIDNRFTSIQCGSYNEILNNNCTSIGANVNMGGEPSNHNHGRGIYYLKTSSKSPYARG